MPKLSRSADGFFVEMNQPGMLVRFNRLYGGAPNEIYNTEAGQKISVVSQPIGEGFQIVWDTGQDGTQGSPNGLDGAPLDPTGYYAREEAYIIDTAGREALYQIGGPAPYFWASVEAIDDCIPPDPRGDHRWSTAYHDILNLGLPTYHGYGVPIFFAGTPQVNSGIILMGDEIKKIYDPNATWNETAARVEGGNIAFRVAVSMLHANADAVGGIVFANNANLTPSSNINDVYAAQGCMLLVNKTGGMGFHQNGVVTPFTVPAASAAKVNTEEGMLIEVRTEGALRKIYADGVMLGVVSRLANGPYTGLFGSGAGGRIKFQHRFPVDTGTVFCAQYRSTPRNTLLQTLSVYRSQLPLTIPFYRTNLPVAFVDPAIRARASAYDAEGREIMHSGLVDLDFAKALYAGRADGSAGLFCIVHGWSGNRLGGAHAGLDPAHIALNNLDFEANNVPFTGSHFTITSEWAPKLRLEML